MDKLSHGYIAKDAFIMALEYSRQKNALAKQNEKRIMVIMNYATVKVISLIIRDVFAELKKTRKE